MEDSVMSGLLRFSLKDLVGEILQRMRDLCGQYKCVRRRNMQKPVGMFFSLLTVFFIHSFANFTQYSFDEEQHGRLCEVPKNESSGILYLPQVTVVPSG